MRGIGSGLLAWLEFAAELGVEGLPGPAMPAGRRAPRPVAAPGLAPPAPPAAGERPESPVDRIRRSLLAPRQGAPARDARAAPPAALAPGPSRSARAEPSLPLQPAASANDPASAPPGRLRGLPPELLFVPPGPAGSPGDLAGPLGEVRAELGDCRRCKLAPGRTNLVFGTGNPGAELMFVGEGPGRDEDLQGLPFVGRAGQLLNDIIKAIGMVREDVYIANVVKCRPPDNRTPEPDEVAACKGFLFRQLNVIRPRVVVALGKPAAETLLGHAVAISTLRGQALEFFGARLVPTFHPAYLLRNPARKREVWEDMKLVMRLLGRQPPG